MTRTALALASLFVLDASATVRPRHPTSDKVVQIKVPHANGGGCRIATSVRREEGRGRTLLHASARPTGRCRRIFPAGHVWHTVGKLKPGRYVVVTTDGKRHFTVLKAREPKPVGDRPSLIALERAVIDDQDPKVCVGKLDDKVIARSKRKHRRLWKAAGRFWPRSEDEARFRRVEQLRAVKVVWARRGTYRYRYTEGCDKKRTWTGTLTVAPAVRVGPRTLVDK